MYFTTLFLMFDLLIHVHTYEQSISLVFFLHVFDYR